MSGVAVLGAGAGGLALTVELVRAGHRVGLWNRNPVTLEGIRERGSIRCRGVLGDGEVVPTTVTTELDQALEAADAVVVCLPALVHGRLFAELAGRIGCRPVILNPGHTGGALHLRASCLAAGESPPPTVELSTLTCVARAQHGDVLVTGRARRVWAGVLPGGAAAAAWAGKLFPAAVPASDVLGSSLANPNLVLHPPVALLSTTWIEATGGDFLFYVDGMTAGALRAMKRLDEERLAVARAWGHDLPPLVEEMAAIGTAGPERDLARAVRTGEANRSLPAPDSLGHRYFLEDIPFGLIPLQTLARIAGVEIPLTGALVEVGRSVLPEGALDGGRDAETLGLADLTAADVRTLVQGER